MDVAFYDMTINVFYIKKQKMTELKLHSSLLDVCNMSSLESFANVIKNNCRKLYTFFYFNNQLL